MRTLEFAGVAGVGALVDDDGRVGEKPVPSVAAGIGMCVRVRKCIVFYFRTITLLLISLTMN